MPTALAFALGIGLSREECLSALLLGLVCILALCALAVGRRRSRARLPAALVLAPAFVFLGDFAHARWLSRELPVDDLSRYAGEKALFEGRIQTSPDLVEGQTVFDVVAERVFVGGASHPATGFARVRVLGRRDDLQCGQRVKIRASLSEPANLGNPGDFDTVSYLRARGITAKALVPEPRWIEVLDPDAESGIGVEIERFRSRASRFLDGVLPRSTAEVYKALILGKEGGIPPAQWREFAETGTVHLLAISGMNVGIVSIVVYALVRACLLRIPGVALRLNVTKICAAVSFVPAVAYAAVAGWRVSTERSVVMLGCCLGAVFLGRETETLNALGLAALICLVRRPASLFEPGFQLSFVAVAALVLCGWPAGGEAQDERALDEARKGGSWARVPVGWLQRLGAATLAAQLGTAPLTLVHFQTLVLAGMIANLVAVPLLGFLAVCPGLIGLLLMSSWPSASELLFIAGGWLVELGCRCVAAIAKVPFASVHLPQPTLVEIAIAYLGIGSFFLARSTRAGRWVIRLCAALLLVAQGARLADRSLHADLRAYFVSVGQGDCTLVELPGGKVLLVDGGGWRGSDLDVGERIVVPFLRRRGIRTIDLMVLSHPQWDHMGGLLAVVREMRIRELWWSGVREDRELGPLDRLLDALWSQGSVIREKAADPVEVRLGEALIEVLHPPRAGGGALDRERSINDDSLVLRIVVGRWALLFTGDVEAAAETEMTRGGRTLAAQVIKVPHHGSPTSSTEAFVDAVHPLLGIVTVGARATPRFPAAEVVRRYRSVGCRLVRTGDGAVEVRIADGKAWWSRGTVQGWGERKPLTLEGAEGH